MTATLGARAIRVHEGALWCERTEPVWCERTEPVWCERTEPVWCERTGRPAGEPVVLVHGFSLDRSMWEPQIAAMAEHQPTIAYDLRGFGRSTPPHPDVDHVDDLLGLLDALGVPKAHVVGLSLGANVALATAERAPGRVRSLVLASPGLPGLQWRGERPPDAAAAVARSEGVDAARRFWLEHRLFAPARARADTRVRLERMVAAYAGLQWGDGPASRPLPGLVDAIQSIDTPTLVVSGTLDIDGYREIAHLLARRLPNASLLEIVDAGHLVSMERPAPFNEAVSAHLAAVGAEIADAD